MRSRYDDSFGAALMGARDEIEDLYRIEIDIVLRSDAEFTEELLCVVDAAREAMLNAARHSGGDKIELFSEIVDDTVTVHVRDRGRGFDADRLDPARGIGRHLAKVEESGGTSTITTRPGGGTEITLTMAIL
jgi:signal transduction histidine kinase